MKKEQAIRPEKGYITAESVTIGHPDKLCDIIADAILTECLKQDPWSRVACEVLITDGLCVIAGEITTNAKVHYEEIAAREIEAAGYSAENIAIQVCVHDQSPDIAFAVDWGEIGKQAAGDQGIVYGYSTDETKERLPIPFLLARELTRGITKHSRQNPASFGPDGKAQVTIDYTETTPRIDTVVVSAQHRKPSGDKDREGLFSEIRDFSQRIITAFSTKHRLRDAAVVLSNPSGEFVKGGFEADTGLTGRKLMVDTYGGIAHHGGGAFSGKDPSKLDRSGAYMARYVANHIVEAGLAHRCEVSIAYAIGCAEPIAIDVNTFGTSELSENAIGSIINRVFDLTPSGIIRELGLKNVDYKRTAIEGHFGGDFPWEQTPHVEEILRIAAEYKDD